jgi:hypothetical protein
MVLLPNAVTPETSTTNRLKEKATMLIAEELARARHEHVARDVEQIARARRLIAARKARRRAERAACVAREAALQASLAHSSLM